MLPIQDSVPTRRLSVFTIVLIALNILVFLYELMAMRAGDGNDVFASLGLIPALASADPLGADTLRRLLTSMFTHAGILHIASNMLYLWIFGNNIEDALGPIRFILFYLVCGAVAAAAQVLINPTSSIPMVGASGAVAGVLGAYLVLYPRARVRTLIFLGYFARMANLSAVWVLGSWFVLQLLNGLLAIGTAQANMGGTAFWAHIGGFVAGMALIRVFLLGRQRA